MASSVYVPRRYYLECLIYNRGYDSVSEFSRDLALWVYKNKHYYIGDSLVRQYIIDYRVPSMEVVMAIAQFLNAVDQVEQINAVFIPPASRCCGGYWVEQRPPNYRDPFVIQDLDMSVAFEIRNPGCTKNPDVRKFLLQRGEPQVPRP